MAIARAQSKTGVAEDNTTLAVQLDDTLDEFDFVVATIGLSGSDVVTSVSGNNAMRSFSRVVHATNNAVEGVASNIQHWVSPRNPATPSFPTVTVTTSAARDIAMILQVFTSVRKFIPVDVWASDTADATTCSTGTTATTLYADACFLAGWCWPTNDAKTATDLTNSFANILTVTSGTAIRLYTAFKVVTAVGTAESTIEIASSVEASGAVFTFGEEPSQETPLALEPDMIQEMMLLSRSQRKLDL